MRRIIPGLVQTWFPRDATDITCLESKFTSSSAPSKDWKKASAALTSSSVLDIAASAPPATKVSQSNAQHTSCHTISIWFRFKDLALGKYVRYFVSCAAQDSWVRTWRSWRSLHGRHASAGCSSPTVPPHPRRPMMSSKATTSSTNNAVQDELVKLLASLSASNQATSIEQFTYFPRLPLELRRQVWSHALPGPGPRIIEIYKETTIIGDSRSIRKDTHLSLFNLKNACKEAQEVVLGKY